MASIHTVLALYSAAGLLELAGVSVTAIDVRAKARVWRKYLRPEVATDVTVVVQQQAAAAAGVVSYDQLSRIGLPLAAALKGRTLAIAATLLMLGVVLGTIANALSATR
jgi:hypothetical protein